jgi:hypothetical protein
MFGYALSGVFSIALFEMFMLLRMSQDIGQIVTRSRDAMNAITSPTTSDEEKELLARTGACGIFGATALLTAKLISCGVLLYFLFELVTFRSPAFRARMLESFVSPVNVAILTVSVVCYAKIRKTFLTRRRNGG